MVKTYLALATERREHICWLICSFAVFVTPYTWYSVDSIRIAGYLLQMAGMILAIIGLLRVRTHFGQKPLGQLFFEWFKDIPRWKGNVFEGVASFKASAIFGKARGQFWLPDGSHQPVAKRINGIVRNLDTIRVEQGKHANLIDQLTASVEKLEKAVSEMNENTKK